MIKSPQNLYRDYPDIEAEHFDIAVVQAEILDEAREYIPDEIDDFKLLATLQHFGAKTNLIDFTTDYLVALFLPVMARSENRAELSYSKESLKKKTTKSKNHPNDSAR